MQQIEAMKLYTLFGIFSLALLTACGGESKSDEAAEGAASNLPAVLQTSVTTADLSEHFINASIIIPDSNRAESHPDIYVNDFGETRIQVGTIYNIVIAELLEGDLNSYRQALADDLTYSHEIIEEGSDFILYKSVIIDSHLDPEFHFYAIKEIDGVLYEIHDYSEEGGYAESIARMMLESVNHMSVNNSAS